MNRRFQFFAITIPYLIFSVTDGATRMLVILHFHSLGFSPAQIAALFLFYEIAGIFTNFLGGWIGSHLGLNITFLSGLSLQLVAMFMMTVSDSQLSVLYVMSAQGLAGISKDLVKISSKSSLKVIAPKGDDTTLFKWVSLLTGSKNSFKGIGYLLGGIMMSQLGIQHAMIAMMFVLSIATVVTFYYIPRDIGKTKTKVKFKSLFSKSPEINVLSGARFFLFGSRDIWFVVGLPVFLTEVLSWKYEFVGIFLGSWIIGYGIAQTLVPKFFDGKTLSTSMGTKSVSLWAAGLMSFPLGIVLAFTAGVPQGYALVGGLLAYGIFFAVNSIIHSYLVLFYSDKEKAASDVGFYYMANSAGRLVGSLLSGWVYQTQGLIGCLLLSCCFLASASVISLWLPAQKKEQQKIKLIRKQAK